MCTTFIQESATLFRIGDGLSLDLRRSKKGKPLKLAKVEFKLDFPHLDPQSLQVLGQLHNSTTYLSMDAILLIPYLVVANDFT